MKRLTSLLLAAVLCVIMVSCGKPVESNSTQPTETTEAAQPETPYLSLLSPAEYEAHFAQSGGYPEGFVTYADLQALGAFQGFSCGSYMVAEDSLQKDYTDYRYELEADGAVLVVAVRPQKDAAQERESEEWFDAEEFIVPADMRTNHTDGARASVMRENYRYNYLYGKLCSIEWTVGETNVSLSAKGDVWPQNDPETLAGKLLIWDAAEAAISQLQQGINEKLKDLTYGA